jgi:hypothetical protein
MVKLDGGHDLVSEEVLIKNNSGFLTGHYNFSNQYWLVRQQDGSALIRRDSPFWRYKWEKPYIET